ncbi:MAG: phage tail length tape measure family protein [Pseudomonadota bacterium]
MSLNLSLVIDGNATGARRAATETATAVQTLGREARSTSSILQAHANANNQAEAASRRAQEAIRGETAAQRDLTAAVLQFAGVRPQTSDSGLRARAADIEAYGAALDQIRAKHVPLFAVQRQYGAQLDEIAAAARVGAITEDERTAAALRAKAAYDQQIMSMTRGGGATRLAAHEIQNLSFQANDMAMMLMSGQSFGIVMAQQGSQVAQILGKRGLGEIIPALGAGFASLVTPTTMALAAITALYYGASWAFSSMSGDIDKTDKELEEHRELIARVAKEWGTALPGLKAYNDELERQKKIRDAIAAQNLVVQETYQTPREALPDLTVDFAAARVDLAAVGAEAAAIDVLQRAFDDLDRKIKAGTATAKDAEAVQKLLTETIAGPLPPAVSAAAERFADLAKQLAAVNKEAEKFRLIQEGGLLFNGEIDPVTKKPKYSALSPLNPLGGFNGTPFQTQEQIMFERSRRQRELEEQLRLGKELGGFVPMPAPNREDSLPSAQDVLRDQEERLQFLKLEAQLIGASDEARARLIARLETEQDLRRRGIDLQSAEAQSVLANAEAIAEAEVKIDKAARAWERWRSAGEDAIDGVVDRLLEGDLEGALEGLGKDAAKYAVEMLLKNPLKNAAYGSGLPTMEDAGGIMGLLARMFGGADKTAASALGQISGVGQMNVTAATVMINGAIPGLPGLAGGNPAANVTKLLSPANNNDPNVGSTIDFMRASNGNLPKSFLDLIGRAEGTDRGRGYNETLGYGAFTEGDRNLTGMTLDQIDALQRQMLAHPANTFNSSALGRYQITGRTLRGLRGEMGLNGSELFDEKMQDEMALRLAQRRGPDVAGLRNEWEGLRGVDPAEILKAYEGTSDAVKKLGSVALPATENLDLFGTGLGDIGKSITEIPTGQGAGGGIMGLIMKLLGGVLGFADGTEGAPAGWAWVGENGPELRKLRQGDVIRSNERSKQMVAESAAPAVGFAGSAGQAQAALLIPQKQTVVNNYADVDVTSTQKDDGQGGIREEIIIERKIAAAIGRPGSAANKELRAGGFQPRRPLR